MRENKSKQIIIALSVIVLVLTIALFVKFGDSYKPSGGVKWDGDQVITKNESSEYITVPCVEKMFFEEGTTRQKVNIHNPSTNKCDMDFTILLEDTYEILWSSETIKPGNGLYEINLNRSLEPGVYNAQMLVKCKEENSENYLNSGIVSFQIIV